MSRKTIFKHRSPARLAVKCKVYYQKVATRLDALIDRFPMCSLLLLLVGCLAVLVFALSVAYKKIPAARPVIYVLEAPCKMFKELYRELKLEQETDDLDTQYRSVLDKDPMTAADSVLLNRYHAQLRQIIRQP